MGLNDGITYYYNRDASRSPSSSPAQSTSSTMFWGLNQRIDNTEKQTIELSIQSERQIKLIQTISTSHSEAMNKLLSRIERNEQLIVGLQVATESLDANQQQLTTNQQQLTTNQQHLTTKQQQYEQHVRALEAEIKVLKEQVHLHQQVLQQQQQQQQQGGSAADEEGPEEEEERDIFASTDDDDDDNNGNTMTAPERVIFTDVYGRKRRLCRYCGLNLGASYCNVHERERKCFRSRYR